MRRQKSTLVLFLLLALPGFLSSAQAAEREFLIHLYMPYMEPGIGQTPPARGDEMKARGDIAWNSTRSGGSLAVSMWYHKALATFTGRGRDMQVSVDLSDGGRKHNGYEFWRRQHTYASSSPGSASADKYSWQFIDENPRAMAPAKGKMFDKVNFAIWRHWAKKEILTLTTAAELAQQKATSQDITISKTIKDINGSGPINIQENRGSDIPKRFREFKKPINMRYTRNRLVGTYKVTFYIRAWHSPVKVQFEIAPNRPTAHNEWHVRGQRIRFEYNASQWQRRHGYNKRWGGYRWEPEFSVPGVNIGSAGTDLDELMERMHHYWAYAGVYQILGKIDWQLKQAMDSLAATELQQQASAQVKSIGAATSKANWAD